MAGPFVFKDPNIYDKWIKIQLTQFKDSNQEGTNIASCSEVIQHVQYISDQLELRNCIKKKKKKKYEQKNEGNQKPSIHPDMII